MTDSLAPTMTVREFENGYWYVDELRDFGGRIGIPETARLRKDELERAILAFLQTGAIKLPTKRALRKTGMKDLERGLTLNLRIEHYTSNRETKDFIIQQATKVSPEVRETWCLVSPEPRREEQITQGNHPTYGDLVRQHRPQQNGTIREGASRALHQLRRRVSRGGEEHACRCDCRMDGTQVDGGT